LRTDWVLYFGGVARTTGSRRRVSVDAGLLCMFLSFAKLDLRCHLL